MLHDSLSLGLDSALLHRVFLPTGRHHFAALMRGHVFLQRQIEHASFKPDKFQR